MNKVNLIIIACLTLVFVNVVAAFETETQHAEPQLNFQIGASYCTRALTRADAEAAADLLRKIAHEYDKYHLPKAQLDNVHSMINRLENLPEVAMPASSSSSNSKIHE